MFDFFHDVLSAVLLDTLMMCCNLSVLLLSYYLDVYVTVTSVIIGLCLLYFVNGPTPTGCWDAGSLLGLSCLVLVKEPM